MKGRYVHSLLEAELPSNQLTEAVSDFVVTWDRRLSALGGIGVDVMPAAMPLQKTTLLDQFPDELAAVQTSTSISFV